MIRLLHPEDAETCGYPGLSGLIQDRLQHPGEFYLCEPEDRLTDIAGHLPYELDEESPLGPFEWAVIHQSVNTLEITYITNDDGYALVFMIPKKSPMFQFIKEITQDES